MRPHSGHRCNRELVTSNTPHSRLTTEERFYVVARCFLLAWLVFVLLMGYWFPADVGQYRIYLGLLAILASTTVATMLAARRGSRVLRRMMLVVLLPDLVMLLGFSFLFHSFQSAFYPAVVMLPVVYALVLPKRQAWIVAVTATIAYSLGHWFSHFPTPEHLTLFALEALAVLAVGSVVATSLEKQRQHEREAFDAAAEKDSVNLQLQQRISELQAVSQITEIVHSSLDFDRVGPVVLDIIAKVLGVDACCLFVIDTEKSETLFSASRGEVSLDPLTATHARAAEEHFTCFSAFEHDRTTVLFCASAEDVERLSEEDRLVLGAVASELVVAAENSRLYKLTEMLSVTDDLTGLRNYRYLQSTLDSELERAKRYEKNVSLLMIDADEFKRFNDSEGHVAGDVALGDIAQILRSSVREVDLVARYGGEEFSVVLPETDAAGAFVVAEKIRETVSLFNFRDADGEPRCHITVSVGLATFPSHAWDKDSLLREADRALYVAKNGGKNRVRTPNRKITEDATETTAEDIATDRTRGLGDTGSSAKRNHRPADRTTGD